MTNNNEEDQDGINSLKVNELKDICCYYGLKVSRNKDTLIWRVTEYVKALSTTVSDNDNENNDNKLFDW